MRKQGNTCKNRNCKDEAIRIRGREQYKKNPNRFKEAAHRRRSLFLSAFVEDVSLDYIGNRDKWICHLCNQKVDKTLTGRNPFMPSLDHVLPLSKGGEHSNKNVRISHLRCNLKKHDQVVGEPMLFG
jgi:5-methylcytosine-specific restriction endonuclease McrA